MTHGRMPPMGHLAEVRRATRAHDGRASWPTKEHIMNVTKLIAPALFAAFGTGAFAQEATPDTWIDDAVASKSRHQVMAELAQARMDGSIKSGSITYDFVAATDSVKRRDQIMAEVIAARESGEYDRLNSEAHAFGATPRSTAYAQRGQ
jgi:hypothetical protein